MAESSIDSPIFLLLKESFLSGDYIAFGTLNLAYDPILLLEIVLFLKERVDFPKDLKDFLDLFFITD